MASDPKPDPTGRQAMDAALQKLQGELDRGQEISEVARQSRVWRHRNHFAEQFIAAMERQR